MKRLKNLQSILAGILAVYISLFLPSCTGDDVEPTYDGIRVVTSGVKDITETSAIVYGSVNKGNNPETLSESGIVSKALSENFSFDQSKIQASNTEGDFEIIIDNLEPDTKYEYRAYTISQTDTIYGDFVLFTTLAVKVPVVVTIKVDNITETSAIIYGSVSNDNPDIEILERGFISEYNSEHLNFESMKKPAGKGTGDFEKELSLLPALDYKYRAYAIYQTDTVYGDFIAFKTLEKTIETQIEFNPNITYDELSDVDGNIYKTVEIGTQVWMAENLKTTKYNDGSNIQHIEDNAQWENTSSGAYCNYSNDEATGSVYGKLYNYYAVETNKLCPAGWHVPSQDEWIVLKEYLGGDQVAGGKMREPGTSHWLETNENVTNESGFTALPSGQRFPDGRSWNMNIGGYWWSTTQDPVQEEMILIHWTGSWNYALNIGQDPKNTGFPVRCVKD